MPICFTCYYNCFIINTWLLERLRILNLSRSQVLIMRRCCFPSLVCIRFFNFQLLFRKACKPAYIKSTHTYIFTWRSVGNILLLLLPPFFSSWFSSVFAYCCMQVGHAQSTIYHTVAAGVFLVFSITTPHVCVYIYI